MVTFGLVDLRTTELQTSEPSQLYNRAPAAQALQITKIRLNTKVRLYNVNVPKDELKL